ncbi:MAG: metallophosphoesterase [Oscillospiraceae bacterium]|jgi:predicted MPP superfamily phosphohydrolase|nr:metallophosphoesterase [Oscillospiraceae bacterium]
MGNNKKRTKNKVFAVFTVIFVAMSVTELYISNRALEVERLEVFIKGLPKVFDGYRIAHISDLHGAEFGKYNIDLANVIREEKPDIIVITGDYIDNAGDVGMVYTTARTLCGVAPVYYVPGNHEYGSKIASAVFKDLETAGVNVLRNQSEILNIGGEELILLGIDDPNGPAGMITMQRAVELVRDKSRAPIVMLNHRYDRAEEIAKLDVALALTGHAHGGLIRLPFTDGLIGPGRVIFPKYTNGLYEIDGLTMVTSRGIGNAGISFRVFNRPHIPIITLRSK